MNGYTTIGVTPELQAMMGDEWSEPVRVRFARASNGALEMEIKTAGDAPAPARGKGAPRAADQ
jgi:hypothetical protein